MTSFSTVAVAVVSMLAVGPGWAAGPQESDAARDANAPKVLRLERVASGLDDLEPGKYLVAKDSAGSFYLFDGSKRAVLEFGPKGQGRGRTELPAPPGEPLNEDYAAFAVSSGGRWIGISTAERVHVFEGDRHFRTVTFEDPPALIWSLAFLDETPRLAMARQFVAPARVFPSILESNHVLVTADRGGKVAPFAVPLDLEDTPVPVASLKELCNLQVDEKGRVWAADKARFRLRQFSASGKLRLELTDDDVKLGIEARQFDPEEVGAGADLSGNEPEVSGWSGSMKTAIRAFDVADSMLWLIVNDDGVPGGQRLEIVDVDTRATHSLPLAEGLPVFGTIAVTDRLIVFGSANGQGRPTAFDRDPLDLALQASAASARLSRREETDEPTEDPPQ